VLITAGRTVFAVDLYGCETWLLELRKHVLKKKVMRRIFGPKKEKVKGGQKMRMIVLNEF
jgi:hypothetical protein